MNDPRTCGAAGGAISLWVNIIECTRICGIMTSSRTGGWSGTSIQLSSQNFMYVTLMLHFSDFI